MLLHHYTLQQNHNELLLKLHTIKKGNGHHTELASKKFFQYWEQPLTDFCHNFCIPALSPKKSDAEPVFYSGQGSFSTHL